MSDEQRREIEEMQSVIWKADKESERVVDCVATSCSPTASQDVEAAGRPSFAERRLRRIRKHLREEIGFATYERDMHPEESREHLKLTTRINTYAELQKVIEA